MGLITICENLEFEILILELLELGELKIQIMSCCDHFMIHFLLTASSNYSSLLAPSHLTIPSCDWRSCCCSVAKLCPSLCNPMDCSMLGFPVPHHPPDLPKFMSIESVMPSNCLILCHPLLLLPSVFPSIRVFSNESAVCIYGRS